MRIEIVSPLDASAGLIRWDMRKRAVDDEETRARMKRLKEYDDAERKRKEEESKKEKAKATKQ